MVRKPGLWCMNQGLREGELFELVGRLMGGLGLLGWINTIDTKGLASRDLLFSLFSQAWPGCVLYFVGGIKKGGLEATK